MLERSRWLTVGLASCWFEKTDGSTRTASVDSIVREVRNLQGEIRPELYNLARDPSCTKNVISESHKSASDLHAVFIDFLKSKKYPGDYIKYFRSV